MTKNEKPDTEKPNIKVSPQKKNQTLGYAVLIDREGHQSNLSNFHTHHNAACIKCGKIHATMTRVGAVIFCNTCIFEEFTSDDPVRQERENYLKWLNKSHENQG